MTNDFFFGIAVGVLLCSVVRFIIDFIGYLHGNDQHP